MMEAYFLQDSAYITALAFRIRSILKEGFVSCSLIECPNQPGFLDGSAFLGLNLTAKESLHFHPCSLHSSFISLMGTGIVSFLNSWPASRYGPHQTKTNISKKKCQDYGELFFNAGR